MDKIRTGNGKVNTNRENVCKSIRLCPACDRRVQDAGLVRGERWYWCGGCEEMFGEKAASPKGGDE